MPYSSGLLDLKEKSESQIQDLFQLAHKIKKSARAGTPRFLGLTAALLFLEPSTRTRFSFETACARLGVHPLILSGNDGTSAIKGESFEDTVLNMQSMNPELFIIRCGDDYSLKEMSLMTKKPVINAGWGLKGHPTQALLDAFCWQEQVTAPVRGQRLLIVGDVKHSRVAASHQELAQILGYEVAFCGPKEFLPEIDSKIQTFSLLSEGLKWANAVMALRVQLERHSAKISLESYKEQYQLNKKSLETLGSNSLIFHPGPVNYGIELDILVSKDSRCRILNQVEHGVWLRQALLQKVLEGV